MTHAIHCTEWTWFAWCLEKGRGPGRRRKHWGSEYTVILFLRDAHISSADWGWATGRGKMAYFIQTRGCSSGVEHVPRMHKVLGLICSSLENKRDFLFYISQNSVSWRELLLFFTNLI